MQRLFDINTCLSDRTKDELLKEAEREESEADNGDADHSDDPRYEWIASAGEYQPKIIRRLGGTAIKKDFTTAPLIKRGAVGALNNCLFDKHGVFVSFAPGATGADCPHCTYRPQILTSVLVLRCARGHYFSVPQGAPNSFAMPMQRVK
jgi:hypothetical protein